MDPLSTIEELEDCVADRNYAGAVERIAAYYQWRLKGGFMPVKRGKLGDELVERLAVRLADKLSEVNV